MNLLKIICPGLLAAFLIMGESVNAGEAAPKPGKPETGYQWIEVCKQAEFAARDGPGTLSFRGKLWLLGGWNPGDKEYFPLICNNEVWSSMDGKMWTLEKPNTFKDSKFDDKTDWEGRHTAGYAVFKDMLWIVGGDPIQGHYQDNVWCSRDGKTWQCVARKVPWGPRALHYTVVFKDKLWVMGGQTIPRFARAEENFYDDVWCSADGVTWEQVKQLGPHWPARGMIGGSAIFQNRIWLLGGGTYETPLNPQRKYFNDVWSSADGSKWEQHLKEAPWPARQYHEVAVFDGKLWVLEGWWNNRNNNDVWCSPDGINWSEIPKTPWKPRHAAGIVVHNNALWVIAGNNMESDVWKLVRKQP